MKFIYILFVCLFLQNFEIRWIVEWASNSSRITLSAETKLPSLSNDVSNKDTISSNNASARPNFTPVKDQSVSSIIENPSETQYSGIMWQAANFIAIRQAVKIN